MNKKIEFYLKIIIMINMILRKVRNSMIFFIEQNEEKIYDDLKKIQ